MDVVSKEEKQSEQNAPETSAIDIPQNRIDGAKAYGTWGGESWRDLFASDQLAWADNAIRMANKAEKQEPESFNKDDIVRRDVLYQWRNAYLGEYNSAVGKQVDSDLEDEFQKLYTPEFEAATKDLSPEEADKAKRKLQGFQNRRKMSIEYKRTGPLEDHSPDDDLFAGTGEFSRDSRG